MAMHCSAAHLSNHVRERSALHAVACGGGKQRVDLVCHGCGVLAAEHAALRKRAHVRPGVRRRGDPCGDAPAGSRTAARLRGALLLLRRHWTRTAAAPQSCCGATWAGCPSPAAGACARCPSAATAAAAQRRHPRRVRTSLVPRPRGVRKAAAAINARGRVKRVAAAPDRAQSEGGAAQRGARGWGQTRHGCACSVERGGGDGRQGRACGGGSAYGAPRFGVVEQREHLAKARRA
jgi:hypothetical protein